MSKLLEMQERFMVKAGQKHKRISTGKNCCVE